MKRTRRRIGRVAAAVLAALLLVTALIPAGISAFAAADGDYEYEVISEEERTCRITKYTGQSDLKMDLTIPQFLGGYAVREIGPYAVVSKSFRSIEIPGCVKLIGEHAFYATLIYSLVLHEGVEKVGVSAFSENFSLKDATIPRSVTELFGAFDAAFQMEPGLTIHGYAGSYAETFANNAEYAFDALPIFEHKILSEEDKTCAVTGYAGLDKDVIVPDSIDGYTVTRIDDFAFLSSDIQSVQLPEHVNEIGESAFEYSELSHIDFLSSSGVVSIESGAFYGCLNLKEIELPAYTNKIGGSAFMRSGLTRIEIPGSVGAVEAYTFLDCAELKSVVLRDGIESIGNAALAGCDALEVLIIPPSVTEILGYALADYTGPIRGYAGSYAETFAKKNGNEFIALPPFEYQILSEEDKTCSVISYLGETKDIVVPGVIDGYTVKEIGDCAFWGCVPPTSVVLPDSVERIGYAAISHSGALKQITLPAGLKVIEDYAFEQTGLERVVIPQGVTEICRYAFIECKQLREVVLPQGLKTIGEGAFMWCNSLESVTVPPYVTEIGEYAFSKDEGVEPTIRGYAGSAAEAYAKENGLTFIALPQLQSGDKNVTVRADAEDSFPAGTELTVENTENTARRSVYDITLTAGGRAIQPNGTVTVALPIPEGLRGKACRVYRAKAGGYTDMNAVCVDECMVFSTDHFSVYLLTDESVEELAASGGTSSSETESPSSGEKNPPTGDGFFGCAALILALAAGLSAVALRRGRARRA